MARVLRYRGLELCNGARRCGVRRVQGFRRGSTGSPGTGMVGRERIPECVAGALTEPTPPFAVSLSNPFPRAARLGACMAFRRGSTGSPGTGMVGRGRSPECFAAALTEPTQPFAVSLSNPSPRAARPGACKAFVGVRQAHPERGWWARDVHRRGSKRSPGTGMVARDVHRRGRNARPERGWWRAMSIVGVRNARPERGWWRVMSIVGVRNARPERDGGA
jgi:hypothetical protein